MLDGMEDDEQALVRPRKDIEIWYGKGQKRTKEDETVGGAVAGVCASGGN